jgi:hypothetical protein
MLEFSAALQHMHSSSARLRRVEARGCICALPIEAAFAMSGDSAGHAGLNQARQADAARKSGCGEIHVTVTPKPEPRPRVTIWFAIEGT